MGDYTGCLCIALTCVIAVAYYCVLAHAFKSGSHEDDEVACRVQYGYTPGIFCYCGNAAAPDMFLMISCVVGIIMKMAVTVLKVNSGLDKQREEEDKQRPKKWLMKWNDY